MLDISGFHINLNIEMRVGGYRICSIHICTCTVLKTRPPSSVCMQVQASHVYHIPSGDVPTSESGRTRQLVQTSKSAALRMPSSHRRCCCRCCCRCYIQVLPLGCSKLTNIFICSFLELSFAVHGTTTAVMIPFVSYTWYRVLLYGVLNSCTHHCVSSFKVEHNGPQVGSVWRGSTTAVQYSYVPQAPKCRVLEVV